MKCVQSINLYFGIERNINSASDFSKEYFFDIVMIQEILLLLRVKDLKIS